VLLGLVTIGVLSQSGSHDNSAQDTATAAAPERSQDQSSAESGAEGGSGDAGGAGTGNSDEAPTSAQAQPDAGASVDSGQPDDETASPTTAAPSTNAPSDRLVDDLGSVSDADELAARVQAARPGGRGSPGAVTGDGSEVLSSEEGDSAGSGADCPGRTAEGDPARGDAVYVADATFAGSPVVVHLYDPGSGKLRLVATDRSCTDVVDVPYTG
jgi:hypothetical protein